MSEQKRCPYVETVNDHHFTCNAPIWDADHCDRHQEKVDAAVNDLIAQVEEYRARNKNA